MYAYFIFTFTLVFFLRPAWPHQPCRGPSLGPVAPPPATALVEAEEGWWAAVRREGLWWGLDPRRYEVVVRAEDALLVRFLRAAAGRC